eukprot:TRINITY_DN1879_c0_g1_i1.p1 TRINITY_DN1879_c0_g1~~TRINITY_DN1879_c0_g1_i1.p1  ORF type:complete len:117 (-),score=24.35 TRINITY_DN1879_c0_g1_i1:493-843(-)
MIACQNGHLGVCKVLLERRSKSTPLDSQIFSGLVSPVAPFSGLGEVFLSKGIGAGVGLGIDVQFVNKQNKTAAIIAKENSHHQVYKLVMSHMEEDGQSENSAIKKIKKKFSNPFKP